ncbi:type IV pilus modification protein PilV [Stutzerimonas degradans]|uniref:Type IV pilus modification protein PilV n=1 Tax=Stutzerimonas degradans TaxID=2968968 RepID=A0A8E2U663_9GAMM|nr:type IV pilus modification protein PilV [Stutzerimonas degradans]MCQ4274875.1 type IV pilus modification protein PilV [Stutzerimonas degradans]PNF78404.1 type IV pilus modification protein PilV [Stutzerimonas degradans]QPT20265.1 type IV pilus modification protein PilV [Stutzerimonas degradans]
MTLPIPGTPIHVRGATLIEVLVALLVLSVGLLGLAGLQMTATKSNHSAYYRSQATLLAYDITDRMRANRADALNGVYDQVLKNTECDVELAPSGSLAQRDMAEWLNSLSCLLSPDAQGSVQRNGRQFTVSIEWNDNRGRIEDADANDRETFVYRTQL